MKLLAKNSLYYLLLSIPILIFSGVIGYYVIKREVNTSNDELLLSRKEQIVNYIKNNDSIALLLITKIEEAQIDKILTANFSNRDKFIFSDTLILDKGENELAENRMITSIVKINNANYQIKLWRSTLEFDELIEGILYLLVFILFFLFLISLLINIWISKTLWTPFYKTIVYLKNFRASDNVVPEFIKTTIIEFETLNKSLYQMMDKMIIDYNSQKKFTENASHEIQTPLAVIKSKIDLLIQSENLKENDVDLIASIDDACSKLIRLNKSLLLLTKIGNRQFKNTENVSIINSIGQSLVLFEEQIKANKIKVIKEIQADFLINMNPDLCLILINNLIQNAIRHNFDDGVILIIVKNDCLSIQNYGKEKPLDTKLLFQRFQKNTTSQQSIGLGLAIAKEITDVSGLNLSYEFLDAKHCFNLKIN
jgi:signal transduction histidine kinase